MYLLPFTLSFHIYIKENMAIGARVWPLALSITLLQIGSTFSRIEEGILSTEENWAFLTSFCFNHSAGELKYHFEYPETYATQNIMLYLDSQWPSVYPKPDMTCLDKEDKVYRGNNQVINLTTNYIWSGCTRKKILNISHLECIGDRRFVSNRERWWYIAVSNCNSTKGLLLKYRLEESGQSCRAVARCILPNMHITCFIAFAVMWILGVQEASVKTN